MYEIFADLHIHIGDADGQGVVDCAASSYNPDIFDSDGTVLLVHVAKVSVCFLQISGEPGK